MNGRTSVSAYVVHRDCSTETLGSVLRALRFTILKFLVTLKSYFHSRFGIGFLDNGRQQTPGFGSFGYNKSEESWIFLGNGFLNDNAHE